MYNVKNILIEDPVAKVRFACDVFKCKGACCTLAGGKGAPLLDEELAYIDEAFPIVRTILPREHLETIERYGLYEGFSGSYTTMCYNNHACVFVFYENNIARCAFEKLFLEGKLNWKKPLSCHLFPIRVNHGFAPRLRYERIDECEPALERGENEDIYLTDFLSEPLTRLFGGSWYEQFLRSSQQRRPDFSKSVE